MYFLREELLWAAAAVVTAINTCGDRAAADDHDSSNNDDDNCDANRSWSVRARCETLLYWAAALRTTAETGLTKSVLRASLALLGALMATLPAPTLA